MFDNAGVKAIMCNTGTQLTRLLNICGELTKQLQVHHVKTSNEHLTAVFNDFLCFQKDFSRNCARRILQSRQILNKNNALQEPDPSVISQQDFLSNMLLSSIIFSLLRLTYNEPASLK